MHSSMRQAAGGMPCQYRSSFEGMGGEWSPGVIKYTDGVRGVFGCRGRSCCRESK